MGSGRWDCGTEAMQKLLDKKAHAQLTLLSLLIHLNLDAATLQGLQLSFISWLPDLLHQI